MSQTTATATTTLGELFAATAAQYAERVALRTRGDATVLTWGEYAEQARACAAGLRELGIRRGDTVALWLTNRPEFHVADVAALQLGAAPYSIYNTYTVDQAAHPLADADTRVLVTETAFLDRALAVRASGATPLQTIVVVDGATADTVGWDDLLTRGAPDFAADLAAVRPDDLATLIYTSGTTGAPKGVEITHANLVTQMDGIQALFRTAPGMRAISWLPMAHIAERMCTHYLPLRNGMEVTTCDDPRAIADALVEVRPGFFFTPPRVWEKLRSAVLARADGPVAAELDAALARVQAGEGPQDGPIQTAIRASLGLDHIETAIVGAAPCPAEIVEFWQSVGVPLQEGYGMSETTAVATINPPEAIRAGTVGVAVPNIEIRLSDDGEVLMRGPVIMRGYRNLPDRTAEAIDADGWLHSGDVGVFDADGYLRIVDRIKELIINAAGKNMSPANIEATVKGESPLISQICAVGDARPYNVALVTIDAEAAATYADDAARRAEVAAAIERANARLARVEQIKRFTVLDTDWAPGGDELTPTMKLKRKPIAAKYAAAIDALYAG